MVDFILFMVWEGKDYNISEDGQLSEMIITETLCLETWLPDNINFKRYQSYITEDQIKTYEHQWNDGCIPQKDLGFSLLRHDTCSDRVCADASCRTGILSILSPMIG